MAHVEKKETNDIKKAKKTNKQKNIAHYSDAYDIQRKMNK